MVNSRRTGLVSSKNAHGGEDFLQRALINGLRELMTTGWLPIWPWPLRNLDRSQKLFPRSSHWPPLPTICREPDYAVGMTCWLTSAESSRGDQLPP